MSKLQDPVIKLIDYRNACYQGFIADSKFTNTGIIVTQDFLFCLAKWDKNMLSGPAFIVHPNQKIMYGNFIQNNVNGLICYELSNECKIYRIYGGSASRGQPAKSNNKIAISFPAIACVLEVQMNQKDTIQSQKQHNYEQNDRSQKWNLIQQILSTTIPQNMKSYNKFIEESFIKDKKDIFLEEIFGDQYFIGAKLQGLGCKLKFRESAVKSIGYYDEYKSLKLIGKKIINKQMKVREEGIYNQQQTLIRYQDRPTNAMKKLYRDYFRHALDFENRFIQLTAIQNLQKQFQKLIDNLKDNTTKRIAQQLIQHLQDYQRQQQDQSKIKAIRQSRRDKAKKMSDVSIDQLKDELNRSINNRKSQSRSPYKQFDTKPAQLKYTTDISIRRSNTDYNNNTNKSKNKYNADNNNTDSYNKNKNKDSHYGNKYDSNDHNRSHSPYNYDRNKNIENGVPYTPLQNRYKNLKNHYIDHKVQPMILDEREREKQWQRQRKQRQYQRDRQRQRYAINQRKYPYPIDQQYRPINKHTTSRSPIKIQPKTLNKPKYKYTDEQYDVINPQRRKQYNKDQNKTYNYPQQSQNLSRVPIRKTTPNKAQYQKFSKMYDEIQEKQTKNNSNKYQDNRLNQQKQRKYPLNHGRGYQFNDDNQFQKQMGLVRTGRKVQSPTRKPVSPYKNTTDISNTYKYDRPYQKYQNTQKYQNYGRRNNDQYQKYNNTSPYNKRKTNHGYFNKNNERSNNYAYR